MLKISFLIMLFLGFTGCTKIQPYVTQYKLNTNVAVDVNKYKMCKEKTLTVAHAFSPNSLMLDKMNYMSGKYTIDAFTQSQWIETPNKSITMQTIKAIENSQLYKHVAREDSSVHSDLILENNIEDFMQYFSKNETESHVKVVITATLIDTKTKKSLGHKKFAKMKKSESIDAYGGVVGLNHALSEILEDEVKWLGEMCK